jgi:hypothetical protein
LDYGGRGRGGEKRRVPGECHFSGIFVHFAFAMGNGLRKMHRKLTAILGTVIKKTLKLLAGIPAEVCEAIGQNYYQNYHKNIWKWDWHPVL